MGREIKRRVGINGVHRGMIKKLFLTFKEISFGGIIKKK